MNVRQSHPGFLRCQIRLVAHLCRACANALPIDVRRFNLIRALGGTTRGWLTSDCRHVNIAIVCSMLEYTAAAWEPWLSSTSTSKLEKAQLEAVNAIIGLVRPTTVEAVLAESQLPPISMRFRSIFLPMTDE